eukprot:SAG11_NODE_4961_length_1709_cov_1.122981_1_plen_132_part_00
MGADDIEAVLLGAIAIREPALSHAGGCIRAVLVVKIFSLSLEANRNPSANILGPSLVKHRVLDLHRSSVAKRVAQRVAGIAWQAVAVESLLRVPHDRRPHCDRVGPRTVWEPAARLRAPFAALVLHVADWS